MLAASKQPSVGYLPRHKTNPFQAEKKTYSTTVFVPDEYTLNQLLNLPARALRVLMIIAARHDPVTGICYCTKLEMRKYVSISKPNLSHATGELIEAGFVAKGKSLDTYYLNPTVFRAMHQTY